jgi:NDP-sugar pyrophosphorylase family protein
MVQVALLAAGEGRRLKPITNYYPKPLLPIVSRPLLEYILLSLKEQDVGRVCINVCHLKDKIIDFLESKDFGIEIVLSEEAQILGTGGGIGKMKRSIDADDFVVHNGDIFTNIRFGRAWAFHREKRAMATLIVERRRGTRDVLIDDRGRMVDIAEQLGRSGSPFGFTGIAILNRAVFDYLPECNFADMVAIYASMIEKGEVLYGFESKDHYWFDIGTKEKYLLIHRKILVDTLPFFDRTPKSDSALFIGDNSWVSEKADLSGFVSIGTNCTVEAGIRLRNCVLFDDTHLMDKGAYADKVISPECIA